MQCENQSALEIIQASIFFVYFQDHPEDLIQAAIDQVACTPEAMILKGNCPKIYEAYLAAAAMSLLIDVIQSADQDGVAVAEASPAPALYLKKRKILDIECEWAEVKACLDCDSSVIGKLKSQARGYLQLCEDSVAALGGSTDFSCKPKCDDGCHRYNHFRHK